MTELTLEKIAAIAHLNTAYFLRQFKNYFLVTPYQYIIERRLDEAKRQFETSDISVTDVCFSVGYHDLTSFIKLFKKNFSLSPECYQKQFRRSSVLSRTINYFPSAQIKNPGKTLLHES